jgi:PHS family inorganic phosphate transporter-like MFS transporter
VIIPSLAFIYWNNDSMGYNEAYINAITLIGSLLGQLVCGFLADKYGRRRFRGIELCFMIFGTLGLVMVTSGDDNSMTILTWIIFYRSLAAVGVGAEYPLSAVITAEYACYLPFPRSQRIALMNAD